MTQGQPIETAPKNGTDILCFDPEENSFVVVWFSEYYGWMSTRSLDPYYPTLWWPLPPIPQTTEQGAKP
jgi:hypothetical protein